MNIKRRLFNSLLKRYGLTHILSELSKYLTHNRIEKIEKVLKNRIKSISVAFESPVDIHNAMASYRTIEAFGLMQVNLINAKFKKSKGKKTTQGAHQWLDIKHFDNLENFLNENKAILAGASLNGTDKIEEFPMDKDICLIFGNEKSGLSNAALENCSIQYKIPMYGMSGSYNLSISCALSLHNLLKLKRGYLNKDGELNNHEIQVEKAWYYFLSLGMGLSEKILNY